MATLTRVYLGIVPTATSTILTLLQGFLKYGETLRSAGLIGGGGETDLTVLWYLLQVVPQYVLSAVTAGEALVQSLQVQVFSLQVP